MPYRRLVATAVITAVGVLYYQPLRAYLDARQALAVRAAEVRALGERKRALERQLAAQASDEALLLEGRRRGSVRPGEQLFIVKGIPEWRQRHASRPARPPGEPG